MPLSDCKQQGEVATTELKKKNPTERLADSSKKCQPATAITEDAAKHSEAAAQARVDEASLKLSALRAQLEIDRIAFRRSEPEAAEKARKELWDPKPEGLSEIGHLPPLRPEPQTT